MMNQREWLVDISRAKEEFRMFTDCPEVVEQRVVMPEEQKTALSLVGGYTAKKMEWAQEADLQQHARRIERARAKERGNTWER
jgi:hypothetical protein